MNTIRRFRKAFCRIPLEILCRSLGFACISLWTQVLAGAQALAAAIVASGAVSDPNANALIDALLNVANSIHPPG
jgi:hypothetical protein